MAFCKKGLSKVKEFWSEIDDNLETIIDDVTIVTGKIKDIKGNPTVQMIDDIIPDSSPLQVYFNTGIDLIIGTATTVQTFAEKLSTWLHGKTEKEANSNLFKLASTAVALSHDNKKKESFYDTAVQVHIEGLK